MRNTRRLHSEVVVAHAPPAHGLHSPLSPYVSPDPAPGVLVGATVLVEVGPPGVFVGTGVLVSAPGVLVGAGVFVFVGVLVAAGVFVRVGVNVGWLPEP
jgi:hypothetical protein